MEKDHNQSNFPSLTTNVEGHDECSQCGRIIYKDPKLAVGAIIPKDGGIVLVRRAIYPGFGMWSFPAGYVNRGEGVESALRREVREETGLEIIVGRIVGLYSYDKNPVVLSVFNGEIIGGDLIAGDETSEVGIFQIDNLPQMAFDHDENILKEWSGK